MRAARRLSAIGLEYLEDPSWGLEAMARVRSHTDLPLATNMVVVGFDQLAPALRAEAVDIVLGDIYHFDGMTGLRSLAAMCEAFGFGLAMHSGTELGVAMAAMVHVAATIPNLSHDCDAHYHHLVDDVLVGGKLAYVGGAIAVPDGPGLGVALDEDRVARYEEVFAKMGDYQGAQRGEQDSEWFQMVPAW